MFLDSYDLGHNTKSGLFRSSQRHFARPVSPEEQAAQTPGLDIKEPARSREETNDLAGFSRTHVWDFWDWLPARQRHSRKRFEEYSAMVDVTRIRTMAVVCVLLVLSLILANTQLGEESRFFGVDDWLQSEGIPDHALLIDELNAVITTHTPRRNERRFEGARQVEEEVTENLAYAPMAGNVRAGNEELSSSSSTQTPPPLIVPPAIPELIPVESRIEKLKKRPPMMTTTGVILSGQIDFPEFVGRDGSRRLMIQYPEAARIRLIEGRTVVSFRIQPNGKPTNVGILLSSHPLLDSAAVRAIRGAMFKPALQEGTPIAMEINLPINFKLFGL